MPAHLYPSQPLPSFQEFQHPVAPDTPRKRQLRSVIGIKEDILDWVPTERARYTGMALIVVNTAILAGFSMVMALNIGTGVNPVLLLPLGVFWGFLIGVIDAWLISSTHGVQGRRAYLLFIPRLVISIILGAVIAEPIVLWVFGASVSAEVAEHAKHELDTYESHLRLCNPVDGSVPTDRTCAGDMLSLAANPATIQRQIADATAQRDRQKAVLDALNIQLANYVKIAQDECAGAGGNGLTGVRGEGHQCIVDRETADNFAATNHIQQQQNNLDTLDNTINVLTSQSASAKADYGTSVTNAIKAKVDEKRRNLSHPGLPDQFDALSRLTDAHVSVWAATWMLRALLVAVDVMPVLTKMLGRTTVYDTLLTRRLEAGVAGHERRVDAHERADTAMCEVYVKDVEQRHEATLSDMGKRAYEDTMRRAAPSWRKGAPIQTDGLGLDETQPLYPAYAAAHSNRHGGY
jgi:Domain of unknown function (DUF4407)